MRQCIWAELSEAERSNVLVRSNASTSGVVAVSVGNIIARVRSEGDAALADYTKRFDGVELKNISVSTDELTLADRLDDITESAIKTAYNNIYNFHKLQQPSPEKLESNGITLWREYRAIENVGLYIPGGSAPLVSTLLMLAVPAKIAGCKRIVVATPPAKDGTIPNPILYAANLCGVTEIYKMGGAQAIAALAYGTATIKKVDKIFGPGNVYVTEAKQQVARDVNGAALDMPAGPSEVMVIADSSANPAFVAADLLAQAEHDPNAGIVLVALDSQFADNVQKELDEQIKHLSRVSIASKALEHGLVVLVNSLNEAVEVANRYAPEHLMLEVAAANEILKDIQNAGSVFIGHWASEALGDYASGTNHVIPTYGHARTYSAAGVSSFMKSISFQEVSHEGFLHIAPTVERLAELEGLDAHKASVVIRRGTK
ncbi:histidinol dehydrogenase [Deferribacterales bacterium RsTz2092]